MPGRAYLAGSSGPTFAPNRPAGYTTLVDRQWNPTDSSIPGGVLPPSSLSGTDSFNMEWFSGSPSQVPIIATPASLSSTIGVTIPPLPDGNPTAMAYVYPSGFPAGDVPFGVFFVGSGLPATHMYVSMWALMPSNFLSNGNNIKLAQFQQMGAPANSNHIIMFNSQNNTTDGRMSWMVTQGGGGSNQYGGEGTNASGALASLVIPNPPTTPIPSATLGYWSNNYSQWMNIEYLMITETTPGVSSDGVFMGWVNGTLVNSWNNIRYNAVSGDANAFNQFSVELYYGGGGSAAPSTQYLAIGRTLMAVH